MVVEYSFGTVSNFQTNFYRRQQYLIPQDVAWWCTRVKLSLDTFKHVF